MSNIKNLFRKNVREIEPYSSARDEFSDVSNDMIFLDANENPYQNDLNRYPDPKHNLLRSKIASIKNVSKENILFGNGSDEILDLIFRAFCEPREDNIIILPPTYGMYSVLAKLNDVEVRKVDLNEHFQLRTTEILNIQNRNSKLLFICSPNNPTANSIHKDSIIEVLEKFNGIVVIDEAYIDFSEEESWLSQLEKYPNLIVTQTFSKAFGKAGIRLGMCFASKEIITVLDTIKPPYNVNQLTQINGLETLGNIKVINSQVKEILKQRDVLIKALNNINYVKTVYKSEANFILIKVDNANERYKQLLEKGIVVRNRTKEILCENCLRISIGTKVENEILISKMIELQ